MSGQTAAGQLVRSLTYNDVTHVYMLEGQRCRSITNVAKIPTDDYSVNQWRHRMAAIGFILDPTLLEDIAAHRDDANRVNDIVQKAIDTAGGSDASRRGTQAHSATEYHDLDQPLLTEQQRRDAGVWRRTIEAYGIEVDERFIERIVLYPDDLISGRIDRYAWMGGHLFDIDVKTGTSAWRYPHGTAVQLALHVGAPWIAGPSRFEGGIEHVDLWYPRPAELRTDIAYILSMPTREDADLGTLWKFQLTGKYAGHAAAQAAITARHFQMNGSLAESVQAPLRPAPREPEPEPEQSSGWHPSIPLPSQDDLLRIIQTLNDFDKAKLRGMWQAEALPSITTPMSTDDLVRAVNLVNAVDPFMVRVEPEPRPEVNNVVELRPQRTPDEGPDADPGDLLRAANVYRDLPEPALLRVNELQAQAHARNVGFHVGERGSVRRYRIVVALSALAINDAADDETIRMIVAAVNGTAVDEHTEPGVLVGEMDAATAAHFAHFVAQVLAGSIGMTFDDDGRVIITTNNTNQ